MHIGFDFDNTLISYDRLFYQVAIDHNLIPKTVQIQKNAVRDYLRIKGKEEDWTRIQGEVYGGRILEAEPYPNMLESIKKISLNKIPMSIISHKTKKPYLGKSWDLHAAAWSWLAKQGFFNNNNLDWKKSQVYFEETKEDKVKRIIKLGCTHYVDDLPEILEMLPEQVQKFLFDPSQLIKPKLSWLVLTNWEDLPGLIGFK